MVHRTEVLVPRILRFLPVLLALLASPARGGPPTLQGYFPPPDGIETGGVRLVPIRTPKGDFKVWTKHIGP